MPTFDNGNVNRCVNLGWGVFNLHEALGERTGMYVKAGNDANVAALGVIDHNDYCESDRMEEISRSLILSRSERPKADVQMLGKAGFRSVRADTEIWKRTWDDVEKVNFASTPLFLLCAQK